jgi:HEPN domain-containing protein
MKESVKQWLRHSEEELAMARYLLQGGYYRGACYHGQQAIEKALQGALIQQGWDLERIHSIERLVVIGKDYGVFPRMTEPDAVFVDSIYRGRYPAEEGLLPTGEPSASEAERIVNLAAQVYQQLSPESK